MTLGELLNELQYGAEPLALLGEYIDLVSLARSSAAAEACGLSLSDYLRGAARSFVNSASDEEWMQLVARLQDGDCSASDCLYVILSRQLDRHVGENNS